MSGTASAAPRVEHLQVQGIDVCIQGQGPHTLVMVHGWPDTLALWDNQVAAFSPHLRCVRFTLPGFESPASRQRFGLDDMCTCLQAVVDAVSPGQAVTLVLHDWGAVYGYQYALRHPRRVARIVGVDIGDTVSAEFRRSLSLRAKAIVVGYQGWLALAWLAPRALGHRMTRQMARWLRAPAPSALVGAQMNHPYLAQFSGGFKTARPFEPNMPMLYLYGQRKPFLFHAPAWAERLAQRPACAVHGMRAGHWVMINQPEAFNHIVGQWLGLPTGPTHSSGDTP